MYPRYYRATRRFLGEHKQAVTQAGFVIKEIKVRRKADDAYLAEIWPKLRAAARARPKDEVGIIEFALVARKERGAPRACARRVRPLQLLSGWSDLAGWYTFPLTGSTRPFHGATKEYL